MFVVYNLPSAYMTRLMRYINACDPSFDYVRSQKDTRSALAGLDLVNVGWIEYASVNLGGLYGIPPVDKYRPIYYALKRGFDKDCCTIGITSEEAKQITRHYPHNREDYRLVQDYLGKIRGLFSITDDYELSDLEQRLIGFKMEDLHGV